MFDGGSRCAVHPALKFDEPFRRAGIHDEASRSLSRRKMRVRRNRLFAASVEAADAMGIVMATRPMPIAGDDILSIIHDDHQKIDALFADYADASNDTAKLEVVRRIYLALLPHAQAEEEIFYPALAAAAGDDDAIEEAIGEHAAAKKTLESILAASPADPTYNMKVRMLQKEIQHHVREEETELFAEARDAGLDLEALGRRFIERKAELAPQFEQQLGSISPA